MNPLMQRLLSLGDLTMSEREIANRAAGGAPSPTLFVQVAEIFRRRKLLPESVEVLRQGLGRMPQFHAARVALARDCFSLGDVFEAAEQLDHVLMRSPDNRAAQLLRLRLGLVWNDRPEADAALKSLHIMNGDDDFTRSIRFLYQKGDWALCRSRMADEIQKMGWRVRMDDESPQNAPPRRETTPKPLPMEPPEEPAPATPPRAAPRPLTQAHPLPNPLPNAFADSPTLSTLSGPELRYQNLEGFRMVRTHVSTLEAVQKRKNEQQFETATLAEIYVNQGMYTKACDIYQRLHRLNPDDALLGRRTEEIRRLAEQQLRQERDPALHLPPAEQKKVEILRTLLKRLDVQVASSGDS